MTEPPPLPVETKPRRRIWVTILKWIGSAIGVLILGLIVLAAVLASWPDSAAPDDTPMLPQWRGLPSDNPLASFEAWLEEQSIDERDERFAILRKDGEWIAEDADGLLGENAAVLDRFRELAGQAGEPWEWRGGDRIASFSGSFDSLSGIQAASKLASIEVRRRIEKGDADGAIQTALGQIRIGRNMQAAGGPMIHFLVGSTVRAAGLKSFELAVTGADLDGGRIRSLQEDLVALEPNRADLAFAFKAEYLSFKRIIDDLKAGKLDTHQDMGIGNRRIVTPYLQRNDTLRIYLGLMSPIVDTIDQDWNTARATLNANYEEVIGVKSNLPKLFVSSNPVGKILVSIAYPVSETFVKRAFEESARHQLALATLAIRQFELEHGRLPSGLGELTPAILATVPIDPFSGEPVRWDPEARLLYSVGPDGADDGGLLDQPRSSESGDVGWEYWWTESGEKTGQ